MTALHKTGRSVLMFIAYCKCMFVRVEVEHGRDKNPKLYIGHKDPTSKKPKTGTFNNIFLAARVTVLLIYNLPRVYHEV
jgi:hypothetical protein